MTWSSVRPSVCLSHPSVAAAACGRFAAECPAGRRYRSIAGAGAQQQRRRSTALSSKYGQMRDDTGHRLVSVQSRRRISRSDICLNTNYGYASVYTRNDRELIFTSHSLPFRCSQFTFLPIPNLSLIPFFTGFPFGYSHSHRIPKRTHHHHHHQVRVASERRDRAMPCLLHLPGF